MNTRKLSTTQLQAVVSDVAAIYCPCEALQAFAQACQAELDRRHQGHWGRRQATLDGAAIQGRKGGEVDLLSRFRPQIEATRADFGPVLWEAPTEGRKGGETGASTDVNRFTGRPVIGIQDWISEEVSRA